jgi:hypothetical protein
VEADPVEHCSDKAREAVGTPKHKGSNSERPMLHTIKNLQASSKQLRIDCWYTRIDYNCNPLESRDNVMHPSHPDT